MRSAALLLACMVTAASAQELTRPQLTADQAGRHTVSAYLAQGPTPWTPADLSNASGRQFDFKVAPDGSGTHRTLQAAFDALPFAGTTTQRTTIGLMPGTYSGQVCLQGKAPVRLIGMGAKASDVRIVASRYNGETKRAHIDPANPCLPDLAAASFGTASSASFAIFSDDVQLLNLTVENDAMAKVQGGVGYPAGAAESGGAQAVALMTQGDRIQMEAVELLGHQDTLYVRASPGNTGDRVYLRKSVVAGDVDFIFGNGTLVIDESSILSRAGRRAPGEGGHILAPSTAAARPLGFLVNNSRLLAEPGLKAGSISIGRAWDHGVAKGAWKAGLSPNGQALVRNSVLGAHIGPWAPSTSRRSFSSQSNRLTEFENRTEAAVDVERATLAPNDGWASAEGGTQGGASAAPEHVFTVRNRSELVEALKPGAVPQSAPRIVRVIGKIDLSTDANGMPLGYENYRDPAFDPVAFAVAYDPKVWGKNPPSGPLEEARRRSAKKQSLQIIVRVPSRTTLVGVGSDAAIAHGGLFLEKVDNVIIRNLHFYDAYDYFPAWDPNDNGSGEWNSEYDNITLRAATHVWIDHCTFTDGARLDHAEPTVLGRRVQHHDALLDITQQSNWVTVSWNHFRDHDKTTLVGSSDSQTLDADKLKVTFHHNWYQSVKERTPRVRFGQVHVYNNLFTGDADGAYPFAYSLGVGYQSGIYSERNAWVMPPTVRPSQVVRALKGTRFFDRGSLFNGQPVDLVAGLKAAYSTVQWEEGAGWRPRLHLPIDTADEVESLVRRGAGAGKLADKGLSDRSQ
ncbi:MAG: hypothetical protein H7Y28_01990 [Rhodoferax sp.]|nr:hypothetical protein [Rhodoferax sp.]